MSLFDTSGNGRLSKAELKEFQRRTESVDEMDEEFDGLWQTVIRNFNTIDGELTMNGFIAIHEAQLAEGGEDDFRDLFRALGFASDLTPNGCFSLKFDVLTSESKSRLVSQPIGHFSKDGLTLLLAGSQAVDLDASLPSSLSAKMIQINR